MEEAVLSLGVSTPVKVGRATLPTQLPLATPPREVPGKSPDQTGLPAGTPQKATVLE